MIMEREELLLNTLNVLTPVINSSRLTDKNGNLIPNDAKTAAQNLYVDVLTRLKEYIHPTGVDNEVDYTTTNDPRTEYTYDSTSCPDEWAQTLIKSINLLQKQLNDYLSK